MSNRVVSILATISALVISAFLTFSFLAIPRDPDALAQVTPGGAGIVPASVVVAFVLGSMAMRAWPQTARGQGWLVTSCGMIVVVITQNTTDYSETYPMQAAGAGLALAGLCRWGMTAGRLDRALTVSALVIGAFLGPLIMVYVLEPIQRLQVVAIPVLLLLTTAMVMSLRQRPDPPPVSGRPQALTLASAAVLGAGLAAPLHLVVTSSVQPSGYLVALVVLGAAGGAGLAQVTGRARAIQAAGLAIGAVGVYLISVTMAEQPPATAGYHLAMAAMGFGGAIGAAAGLMSQPRSASPHAGVGLGLAALLFIVYGIGQLRTEVVTATAALLMLVLMWASARTAEAAQRRRRWPVESAGGSGGDQ